VERVGLPISRRFERDGRVTQVFQKLALAWHPELQRAVPVELFAELGRGGLDAWLDAARQVPPAGQADAEAALERDPPLHAAYFAAADWQERYGSVTAIRDYGPVVVARGTRAALQRWMAHGAW